MDDWNAASCLASLSLSLSVCVCVCVCVCGSAKVPSLPRACLSVGAGVMDEIGPLLGFLLLLLLLLHPPLFSFVEP